VRIAASGGGCCCANAAVVVATVIGGRCTVGMAVIALSERLDSCCDGGGVFSLEARERCMACRLFSRTLSACAVPAALLRSRCLRKAALCPFSVADLPRLRVYFTAGCVSVGLDNVIVQ
jgi:hypothetical protein